MTDGFIMEESGASLYGIICCCIENIIQKLLCRNHYTGIIIQ